MSRTLKIASVSRHLTYLTQKTVMLDVDAFDILQAAILCRVWRVMKMCHTDVYIYSKLPKNALAKHGVHANRQNIQVMSKHSFRPVSVQFLTNVPFVLAITGISMFSAGTIHVSHTFMDRIACSCLTILMSNIIYVTLTGFQCLRFQIECLVKQTRRRPQSEQNEKKRGAILDDRRLLDNTDDLALITGQYSLKNVFCNTIEFRHAPREIRLFVSRKELWYIFYPSAFAIFVLFYCIPIYDISCTVSLIMGLLAKSCYDEIQRGIHWKRGTGRKICFTFAMLFGILCTSGLLILSIILDQSIHQDTMSTNSSMSSTSSPIAPRVIEHTNNASSVNMLGTLLHGDDRNHNFRHNRRKNETLTTIEEFPMILDLPENISITTALVNATHSTNGEASSVISINVSSHGDGISEEVGEALDAAYKSELRNPNLLQMIIVWTSCLCTPFFLGQTPDSIRLPVLMEIVQPSVSCLAAFVLFLACAISDNPWQSRDLLQSSSVVAYVCFAPAAVWCAIYFVIKASRSKTTTHLCGILMVAAYSKLLHVMHHNSRHNRGLSQVSIFVGFLCAVYTGLILIFIRMENKCIQMGWDGGQDDDDADDYGFDLDMSCTSTGGGHKHSQHGDDSDNFSPRYCIEDVLQRVTDDIKTTEYILSHPEAKSTVVLRTPPISTQLVSPSPAPKESVVQKENVVIATTLLRAIEEDGEISDETENQYHVDNSGVDLEKNALLPRSVDSPKSVGKSTKKAVRSDKTFPGVPE